MRVEVELEILDQDDRARVTEDEMIYDGAIPIPAVGEDLAVEGKRWYVRKRQFSFFRPADNGKIKVTLWCDGPYDIVTDQKLTKS